MLCPQNALTERKKSIGKIIEGVSEQVYLYTGMLDTGEASGVPIIKELFQKTKDISDKDIFIDCPPGSACVVMESIKDADYCILVAEPTIFGVHNLNLVYELVTLFKKPFGVILNKCMDERDPAEEFCVENKIKILGKIKFDKTLGKLNSEAQIAVRTNEKYKVIFTSLLETVKKEVRNETASDS